jgi:hypothetical protein
MENISTRIDDIRLVLLNLCRDRSNGCLLVKSHNRLFQAMFEQGQLVGVTWRNVKGRAAFAELLQIKEGEYNFVNGMTIKLAGQEDLPDLRKLLGFNDQEPEKPAPAKKPVEFIDQKMVRQIRSELEAEIPYWAGEKIAETAKLLGYKMSEVPVEKAREWVKLMAARITLETSRENFLERVNRLLDRNRLP